MEKSATPFNTGKVKIGCKYEPPKPIYSNRDTDLWQSVFLGDYGAEQREYMQVIIYVLVLLILAASLWLGYEFINRS